jgi:hypothetical protein
MLGSGPPGVLTVGGTGEDGDAGYGVGALGGKDGTGAGPCRRSAGEAGDEVPDGVRGRAGSDRPAPGQSSTATATTTAAVTAAATTGTAQRRRRPRHAGAGARPASWNPRTVSGSGWISAAAAR